MYMPNKLFILFSVSMSFMAATSGLTVSMEEARTQPSQRDASVQPSGRMNDRSNWQNNRQRYGNRPYNRPANVYNYYDSYYSPPVYNNPYGGFYDPYQLPPSSNQAFPDEAQSNALYHYLQQQ